MRKCRPQGTLFRVFAEGVYKVALVKMNVGIELGIREVRDQGLLEEVISCECDLLPSEPTASTGLCNTFIVPCVNRANERLDLGKP
jgi:hypothetical protein